MKSGSWFEHEVAVGERAAKEVLADLRELVHTAEVAVEKGAERLYLGINWNGTGDAVALNGKTTDAAPADAATASTTASTDPQAAAEPASTC